VGDGSVSSVALRAGDESWFEDDFRGPELDPGTWLAHYLPAWSSRELSSASHRIAADGLTLDVPVDHPLWCAGDHEPPLRVSGIQSGSWSGPAGSTRGQQRFREGQVVVQEQERFEGWLPTHGRVEISARMDLSPRSMAALWLSGFEDDEAQQRCGELCVFEVFGKDLGPPESPSAEVGVGIKAFRDPALTQDFAAPRVPIDVREPHLYAVEWDSDEAVFTVDGVELRRCPRPPTYPLQLMLAVFDFPRWSTGDDDQLVPRLVVDRVAGSRKA
jgi:glycosyl hydrolase family 16